MRTHALGWDFVKALDFQGPAEGLTVWSSCQWRRLILTTWPGGQIRTKLMIESNDINFFNNMLNS